MLAHLFGPPDEWPDHDLIGFSEFFDTEITLSAYCSGTFPMPAYPDDPDGSMSWWSPVRRGVIDVAGFRPSRTLRRASRRLATSVDADLPGVLRRCADPSRPGGWITPQVAAVFTELHEQGFVHSIETWDDRGRLVGGLYGVSIGGLFAGESMFHDPELGTDASKVALLRLVEILAARPDRGALLDVQWVTPHLASLGAVEISRAAYLKRLDAALELPDTSWPGPERIRHA